AIYAALDDNVETIFGDTIETLDDDGHRVHVEFTHRPPRDFDLVIGADGLHSGLDHWPLDPKPSLNYNWGSPWQPWNWWDTVPETNWWQSPIRLSVRKRYACLFAMTPR